jgi:hypothetical protein
MSLLASQSKLGLCLYSDVHKQFEEIGVANQ